jgi:hypothetical protein
MAKTTASKKCACGCGNAVMPKRTYIHGHNSRGVRHPMWRGGRYVTNNGYVYIWKPRHPDSTKDGYVLEHRLVMEEMTGRRLKANEHVHHINGNKGDNRTENLAVVGIKEHGRIEGKKSKGFPKPSAQRIREDQKPEFQSLYYNTEVSTKQIADHYGLSTVSVHDVARRFGLLTRKKTGTRRVEVW